MAPVDTEILHIISHKIFSTNMSQTFIKQLQKKSLANKAELHKDF